MRSSLFIILFTSISLFAYAQQDSIAINENSPSIFSEVDSLILFEEDSLKRSIEDISTFPLEDSLPIKRNTIFRRVGRVFTKLFKSFNDIDTRYIEPQHYDYTVMVQNTNANEIYTLKSKSGQSIKFSPLPTVKIGPYFGWRWIFFGYTFDVAHTSSGGKTELDVSLYSSLFNIDLYYRKTKGYRFNEIYLGENIDKYLLKGLPFTGLEVDMKGFDLYYIFNHRKFSYPAAFSQSTNQRRSAGSPLVGIGFTSNNINLDADYLKQVIDEYIAGSGIDAQLDTGMMFNHVNYMSFQISGGYAYNWVFAKNFLFAASLAVAVAYKHSSGKLKYPSEYSLKDFTFGDFNIDGVGRFGVVWNNTKLYAGANAILHSYTYSKSQFKTNNFLWSLNIYVGVNIGKRKKIT